MSQFVQQVDARTYQPRDKHNVIFSTFKSLNIGEKMELINDHDPKPLQYQFIAEYANHFEWEYLEQGPEIWRVSIGKK
ncbi:MAG: hemerythrin [Haloplasmataceae bacterium]|jgi:uncharacterized protein (DUF2249 family)|nr:hemerythrin [Haloplasmataceae bacterium]